MPRITIQSINFIDEQITILFDQSWFQEDIGKLRQLLLNKIPEHHVKEITLGADREDVRFQWLNAEFILNFDYYSQSCWVSAHDEVSTAEIQPLFNLLTQS
jgi:hypothetical protein